MGKDSFPWTTLLLLEKPNEEADAEASVNEVRWHWHRRKNGESQVRSVECVYGRLFSPEEEQWDEPERENAPKDRNKSSCVLVEIAPVRISTSVNIGKFDKSNLWKFLPRKKVLPWKGTDTDESTVQRPVPESTNFMEPNPGKIKIARFLNKDFTTLMMFGKYDI